MSVVESNLLAAWIGIFLGMTTGVVFGLSFHREEWLGGFDSWRRRLTRLGHISLFGLALLNLAFVWTAPFLHAEESALRVPSLLLIVGAVTMPLTCFLAAWRMPFRKAFFVPVASLLTATAWVVVLLIARRP